MAKNPNPAFLWDRVGRGQGRGKGKGAGDRGVGAIILMYDIL